MTAETIHTCSYSCERPGCIRAQRDELVSRLEALTAAQQPAEQRAEVEALRAEVERLRDDGASAVRWAPGSAYWSEVLVELFGPDARKGIDVLEARWRKEIERAERLAEALALLPDEIVMVEHNPDGAPRMFCCGRKVKLTWLHDLEPTHNEGCWYARMRAMRDQDQEDCNG